MKRCAECKRDYYDDSLIYCLDDGSRLLEGPAAGAGEHLSELPTRNISPTSDPDLTQILQTPTEPAREKKASRHSRAMWIAIPAFLVVAIGTLGFYLYSRDVRNSADIKSVAVLPLENLSGDPDQEYFANGITEAVIGNLSQIGSIKVISRTSVMKYKKSGKTIPEIARELGVDGIVEGSVQRSGERVRVTAQLIDARSDSPVWSRNFEREMSDILKLESEIAQAIAGEIRAQLTTAEKQRIDKTRPIDPRATEAFLLGRHYFNAWTKESEQKAIEQFKLAVELEPGYADAWAGLADAWTVLGMVGAISMHEAEGPTKDATNKALQIDPDNSPANVSMCFVKNNYDFDWKEGEEYCKRGIDLNPNNPKARLAYAFLLARLERWDEAFPQMEQAVRIDPAEPWWRSVYGGYMIQTRRFEEAEKQLRIGQDIGPDSSHILGALCDLYTELGKYDDALKVAGTSPLQQARIYARMGEREKALERLRNSDQRDQYMLARVYAALGDKDRAFETLNRSLDQGNGFMGGTTVFLEFETLKSDPRWRSLLQRMNR